MSTVSWLKRRIETCPTISWKGSLTRCVNLHAYETGKPPDFLFTSGNPNRCNPAGTLCIYMAEEQETAIIEYNKYAIESEPETFLVFTGQLHARKVLDLAVTVILAIVDPSKGGNSRSETKVSRRLPLAAA